MTGDSFLLAAGFALFSLFAAAMVIVLAGGLLATKSAQNHALNQKLKRREAEITRWADAYERVTKRWRRYSNDYPPQRGR